MENMVESIAMMAVAENLDLQQKPGLENAALAVVPKDMQLLNLEKYKQYPDRRRGKFNTTYIKAFIEYCRRHLLDHSVIYISPKTMSATAIIDDYDSFNSTDSWGDHTATVQLEKTPAFNTLCEKENTKSGQLSFIEWVEDWANHIVFFDVDNNVIPIEKAIPAIRKLDIKTMLNVSIERDEMMSEKSTLEKIQVQSKAQFPSSFTFTCEPYRDFEKTEFNCRLRAAAHGNDDVLVFFRIRSLDQKIEEFADIFRSKIQDSDEIRPVNAYIGTYTNNQPKR